MNFIRPQRIKYLNIITNLIFNRNRINFFSHRKSLISNLVNTQIRSVNYKTPTNATKSKVFKPTTIPVTKANEHLVVEVQDENGADLGKLKLLEAKRMAEKKSFKLVMIDEKPVFKFMTGQDLLKLQLKARGEKKLEEKFQKEKEIEINLGISDHDLDTKVNHIKNFYEKGHPIKIVIKSKILNKKERNIPKLQEEFLNKIKNLLNMGKLNIDKQTEHIIIILIEANNPKKEITQ